MRAQLGGGRRWDFHPCKIEHMTETATWVFESLWIAGILAFAISGALVGVRHNLDLLGILVVGTATGIGGGIIRDMIIGVHPPISLVVWP